MAKLVAAVLASLAVCAPALPASALRTGAQQNILYGVSNELTGTSTKSADATLPKATIGEMYEVAITVYFDGVLGSTSCTCKTLPPGIGISTANDVRPNTTLGLNGVPTKAGTFTFTTTALSPDASQSLPPKQWTLVVAGMQTTPTKPKMARATAKELGKKVVEAIAKERAVLDAIGNDKAANAKALHSLMTVEIDLIGMLRMVREYTFPSTDNPESALNSAAGADESAFSLMLKDTFSGSKGQQTEALNFISKAIAAKKRASAIFAYLAANAE